MSTLLYAFAGLGFLGSLVFISVILHTAIASHLAGKRFDRKIAALYVRAALES